MINYTNIAILKANLFSQCTAKKTGTTILSTTNNKSCQIVIVNGIVSKISFGREKGESALHALLASGLKAGSFMENATLPMGENAIIQSSSSFLIALGFKENAPQLSTQENDTIKSPLTDSPKPSVSVQTYRGQVIEVAQPPKAVTAEPKEDQFIPKKKVRMYRGQVIED